jgi:hypothetical protein
METSSSRVSPIRNLSEILVEVGLATSLRQANSFIKKGDVSISAEGFPKMRVGNTDGLLVIVCPLVLYCEDRAVHVLPNGHSGMIGWWEE